MTDLDETSNDGSRYPIQGEALKNNGQRRRVALVDDDIDFVETLATNLKEEGFDVQPFTDGRTAIAALIGGEPVDVVLLDWRMPGMNGLEVLRELRQCGVATPVIFLTMLCDDIYEEAALTSGALDFVDKSRRLPILLKRIERIGAGQTQALDPAQQENDQIRLGALELRFDISRAFWNGQPVGLTLTEFRMLALLARKPNEDVSFRELYDLVHGKDFLAGAGAHGYQANCRTFIKRIRMKFRAVDPNFEHIRNYARFGYRWVP